MVADRLHIASMSLEAVTLLLCLATISCMKGATTLDKGTTNRGVIQSSRIGDLSITYISGRDADTRTPVFDMSIGDITLENTGKRPIRLKYNSTQTFFLGHSFEFGTRVKNSYVYPRPLPSEPQTIIDFTLHPGVKIPLSRQDFMDLFGELGKAYFLDGTICTRFEAPIEVDDVLHTLRFGPHCFHVELHRDWDKEQERYLQFFKARDGL